MARTARNISRRSLVSGAVATGVLGSCAATRAFADETLAAAPAKWDAAMPEAWDREVGVVIAGTGIAGASAAVEAFDAGMGVLVLTATDDIIDCSCTISGGALSGCCTSLQEDEGIEDSVEAFIRDIRADGGDFGDLECVTAWAENSGDTVDWLIDLGCEVNSMVMQPESHSVARSYNSLPAGNGLGWMEGLKGAIEERGVEVIYSTPVTRIYREADGRVVGVEATPKDGSGPINVKATQGIIMATGGIGSNVDLWAMYAPVMQQIKKEAKAMLSCAPVDVNGKGIELLRDVDAYIGLTVPNYGGGGIVVDPNKPANATLLPYSWKDHPLIEVNANGERFNNESSFSEYFDQKPYRDQPGMWHVVVFDENGRMSEGGQRFGQVILDACAESGITDTVFSANTLEELADHYGMDPQKLVAAVDDYNAHVDSQEADAFGRTEFVSKIDTPPFWGIEQDIVFATSKGGAKINARAQVLDNMGQVIPGLYAAGEVAFFPIHGNGKIHIVGGCNGSAATYGRIAVWSIAEDSE